MKIAVALSGGVDSSVAAYLLKQQGHELIALFMKNWSDEDPNCPAYKDYLDVIKIASALDIPYYTLNFEQEYWDDVFEEFLTGLRAGVTPNPDILCNKHIKFKALFQKAKALGCDYLATGHYARTDETGQLLKAHDANKDQTYFLSAVNQSILKHVLFPIGHLPKSEVRAIAERAGLATFENPDSTGICFIGASRFRTFIRDYIPTGKGDFLDTQGKIIGQHEGLHLYTIGQRKGLTGGGAGDAWYVVTKDPTASTVTLAQGKDHPALFASSLRAAGFHWISGSPPTLPWSGEAKIRYRTPSAPCTLDGDLVTFLEPQRAITPGQTIVFYEDNVCLGSATIT